MDGYNQFFQNPLVMLGAGMMRGADPRGEGLGGLGFGLLNTGQILRQQQQLDVENERARQLADLQMRAYQAKTAGIEAKEAERLRQLQAQAGLLAQPELTPLQRAGIQAGYGKQAMEQVFAPEAARKPYTEAAQIMSDVKSDFLSQEMGNKLLENLLEGGDLAPADRFKMESDLNKRFDKNTQAFKEISNAYTTIQEIPASAIGDVALATKIMKLLDPGSVVRESELGVALGATGLLDRILNTANRVKEGELLTEEQRVEFKNLAENVYRAAQQEFENVKGVYTQRALDYRLKPENVVSDYTSRVEPRTVQTTAGGVRVRKVD